ncbi:MAG: hypothetical protein ACP5N1_06155 [Candidatus Woesearchaeota archaeon]
MLKKGLNKLKNMFHHPVKTLALGVLLYHGISFGYNTINNVVDEIKTPKEFVEFEKNSGVKIRGYRGQDVNTDLFAFLNVLHEEQLKPGELDKIILESPNYFNKGILGQLSQTILTPYSAYYSPMTNNIVMNQNSASTLRHEIAHAKTFNNPRKKELLQEWSELAKDKNGNSYYLNPVQQAASRVRLLEKLVQQDSNYSSLGFTSSYAMTNVYEDIAEFVSDASEFSYSIWDKSRNSPIFEKKLELAVKYELLPKETLEYFKLTDSFNKWCSTQSDFDYINQFATYDHYLKATDSLRNVFLVNSEQFLQDNYESRFCNEILNNRAVAYAKGYSSMGTTWSKQSERELKRALMLPNKGTEYMITVFRLEEIHKQLYLEYGNKNPYTVASKLYLGRRDFLDINLFTIGVNDKLVELGQLEKISQ